MSGAGVGSPAVPRNISEKVSCKQKREEVWYGAYTLYGIGDVRSS